MVNILTNDIYNDNISLVNKLLFISQKHNLYHKNSAILYYHAFLIYQNFDHSLAANHLLKAKNLDYDTVITLLNNQIV